MRVGSRRIVYGAIGTAAAWLLSVAYVGGQAPQTGAPTAAQSQMAADQVFKNVTVLKGIPVDEFMGTMGVFSAALGFSCEDCHTASSNDWANYAKDVSPRKTMARQMVTMMQGLNKQYFGGRQVVTCFTCHRGSNRPKVTASLDILYGAPPPDELDVLVLPAGPGGPTAAQILDKYIAAVGGAARLKGLTAFTAEGIYSGYDDFEQFPVQMFARAPNQRTTILRSQYGDVTTAFDGRSGWLASPAEIKPTPVIVLTGGNLEGTALEAELSFPGQIKQTLTNWIVGPLTSIGDRQARIVQGRRASGTPIKLYFDEESGLLVRVIRYSSQSPVGRVPTQIDFEDYRDVSGIKFPFKWTSTWTDGRTLYQLKNVQVNPTIPAATFARPVPPARPAAR